MLIRSSILPEIGVFDEGIFMYGEDTDLSRRIHQKHKTVFYPKAIVVHHFRKSLIRILEYYGYILKQQFIILINGDGFLIKREK